MTPKEKAKELYNKFLNPSGDTYLYNMLEHESAKECALIAVDEILHITSTRESWFDIKGRYQERFVLNQYWVEVKQEIEKL